MKILMPELVGFKFIPKELFFDRAKITDAFLRGRKVALSKIGAFLMVRARSLTGHSSRKSAQPGQPPRKHAGTLSEKIFFAAQDSSYQTIAVGPFVFQHRHDDEVDVPGLLEEGGTTTIYSRGKKVRANYHKFPFMGPSLEEAVRNNKLSEAWRNVVVAA